MLIELTQGKWTLVGWKDYKYLMQWKWCYHKRGYVTRTDRTNGQKTIYMHLVILERMGYKNFNRGDHINRNKLNNLRSNLRPATHRQDICNRRKRFNTTSKYIGVYWNKQNKKWAAQFNINNKHKFLGYFDSEIEAAKVRNQAAIKYYGKFAVLNGV